MSMLLIGLQMHMFVMQFVTSYSTLTSWLPIIFLAIMASMGLVAAYYMIGALIQSKKIRDTAVYEFGQAIGTGIIVILILAAIALASTSLSLLVPPANTQSICTTLGGSPINILNSSYVNSNSVASPTDVICSNIIDEAGQNQNTQAGADITPDIDYGLGAVYVIVANMTNQTAANLNSLYTFANYVGFLQSFVVRQSLCDPVDCISGTFPAVRIFYSYSPLAGYYFLSVGSLIPLQFQAIFMFEMYIVELISVILLLWAWPYFLAGGLILRATIYGRRLGGLLFAIAVTGAIIYPTVFLMEYSALNSNTLTPIGVPGNILPATFNSSQQNVQFQDTGTTGNTFNGLNIYELPTNDLYTSNDISSPNTTIYRFNAFVFPHLDEVINYNGCWPGLASVSNILGTQARQAAQGNLLAAEASFSAFYLIPLTGLGTGLGNLLGTALGFVSGVPYVPTTCTPTQALQTFFDLINVYGLMSVEGVIMPVLNILIALVAIKGLSGMLGGDQDIVGIGRLI